MHVVVIRAEVVEQNPWIVMNLFKAFEESKRRSYYRLSFRGPTPYMDPWAAEHARRREQMFGADYYPYGIEANRKTLDAFLHYCCEQGVCHRSVRIEELFARQVQQQFRV
jgi:4,5-dihydroxyphthalate decarboxylase